MLPDHPLANDGNSIGAELCSDSLLAQYRSGVNVFMEAEEPKDPLGIFSQMAREDPQFQVGEVLGEPALLVDPEKDPTGRTPGGVSVFLNGLLVEVAGDGTIPLDELIAVAESLSPEPKE
jgi:hypothetical protein